MKPTLADRQTKQQAEQRSSTAAQIAEAAAARTATLGEAAITAGLSRRAGPAPGTDDQIGTQIGQQWW